MKTLMTSLRALAVFTLMTGIVFPLCVMGVAKLFWPAQSAGSLITRDGTVTGSELLAQGFSQPRYFWPRPSAVKFDAASSGASNLSVTAPELASAVKDREAAGAVAEMRFASASGLDPHLSPESSRSQIRRVAQSRNLSADQIKVLESLVEDHIEQRQFGFLGEARVNVLRLNLHLDERFGK